MRWSWADLLATPASIVDRAIERMVAYYQARRGAGAADDEAFGDED